MKILIMGAPTSMGFQAFGIKTDISGGGWVENLINKISNKSCYKLSVMFYADFASKIMYRIHKEVNYIALPIRVKGLTSCNLDMVNDLKEVITHVNPDIVHIIGTEREHAYRLFELAGANKSLISITGIVSRISEHYLAGIEPHNFLLKSIGDIIRHGGPLREKKLFQKYTVSENLLFQNAKYVMGRTTWDYASVKQINPDIEYIYCSEILNPVCFEKSWDRNSCQKHRIFMSQGSYPLKGLHQMLKAFRIVLNKYSDAKLYIAGVNILKADTVKERIKRTTYAMYIAKLIKQLAIPSESICFTGLLNFQEMMEQYLKANVFVLPSAIENSPNSLGEAMALGVPCVASCVGGVQDMLRDKMDGFIYPYDEYYMLAYYIETLFENKELCFKFSQNAREYAKLRFNAENVLNTTIETYEYIYSNQRNSI